ncbi:hypothetical protein LXA43DRAFT_1131719 [Ganoderma leucocontextum]|nr:hypothetical protein LXA43DRAFT_1131719 [Ganoderma leucocontextum]
MSTRTVKSRKSSTRGRVKVDQEENKSKIGSDEAKEHSKVGGITILPGFDPDPIPLPKPVKKDEPSDDSAVREEEKPTNIKPEDTKQQHTKHEVNSRLTPTRLWEHHPDGQRYIPRPSLVGKKFEDIVNDPDLGFQQENLPQEDQELSPPPPPPPQPQPQPSPQPQPQRQARRHYRDGRALPGVEILLPRWEDVRRRKADRAAQTQHAPPKPGAANAHQAPRQDSVFIKPEPDEDVKPLLALEEHDPVEAREVLRVAVQNLRNPDVKVKKELLLDDDFLLDALTWEGINYRYPIPLPKEVSEFQFKREYISHLYGGNTQETFPTPRKEMREWHGLKDWAFLSLDYNPHAPTKPGHSGLFFSSHRAEEEWCQDIHRTFVRVASGKWVYMGQYKMEVGVSLTAESWKQQKQTVRQAWAEGILHAGWGWRNCVRIWLRKQRGADCKITKKDMKEGEEAIKHIWTNLTEEDIIAAYDRGEEEMGTYRMTCIGYEAEFVDVLVRNAPAWLERGKHKKAKRSESKGKGKGKGKQKGKGTGSKRKPIEIESDLESEEDVDVKMEVKAPGSDDSYQAGSAGLAGSSTGRPRRAAAMFKRQRTS